MTELDEQRNWVLDRGGDVLGRLLDVAHHMRGADLPDRLREIAPRLGALELRVHLVDYEQIQLVELGSASPDSKPLTIEGTLAGKAYSEVGVERAAVGVGERIWLPLLDGAERLGLLEALFDRPVDEATERLCRRLAGLVAEICVSRRQYSDELEFARRRKPMHLPAELQWSLLPPLTFSTDSVVISGMLVPSYEVGGDAFDYAVNGSKLHLALIDAMGHGVQASLLSALAIGAYRNARRGGADLADTYRSMNDAVAAEFAPEGFLTAVLAELDSDTGRYRWISAGHPPALLLRQAHVVKQLESPPTFPIGFGDGSVSIAEEALEPGDRLLLYTDGIVEARDADGNFFGLQRLADVVTSELSAWRPAPETMRRLSHALLAHQGGELGDDATTLFLEWSTQAAARMTL